MSTVKYALKYLGENPFRVYKFVLYVIYKYLRIDPIRNIEGIKMVLDLDAHVDRNLFFYGKVDVDLEKFIGMYVKRGDIFFDIGANSGHFSLLAARKVNHKGSVHAFEPVPKTYKNLLRSIKLNKFKNLTANNICIGDKNGHTDFNISYSSDVSGIKTTTYQTGIKIIMSKISTISAYIRKNKIGKIDFIKIDTEGAEFAIISSSLSLLKKMVQY